MANKTNKSSRLIQRNFLLARARPNVCGDKILQKRAPIYNLHCWSHSGWKGRGHCIPWHTFSKKQRRPRRRDLFQCVYTFCHCFRVCVLLTPPPRRRPRRHLICVLSSCVCVCVCRRRRRLGGGFPFVFFLLFCVCVCVCACVFLFGRRVELIGLGWVGHIELAWGD